MDPTLEKLTASLETPITRLPISLTLTAHWTWMRWLASRFLFVQKNREKNATTVEVTTDDKADGTTVDSEMIEEATTDDKADGTIVDSEMIEEATTDDKADGTTVDSEMTEADQGNRNTTTGPAQNATTRTLHDELYVIDARSPGRRVQVEAIDETVVIIKSEEATTEEAVINGEVSVKNVVHSTIMTGHAQSATTRTSHSEMCATDAKNPALVAAVVEAAAEVVHGTTTDGKAVATTNVPPMAASEIDGITVDSEATDEAMTDGKVDETTEVDTETTDEAMTDDKVAKTTVADTETTDEAMTDDKVAKTTADLGVLVPNGTGVAKAKAVQPVVIGNEMDDLNAVHPITTFVGQKASVRDMPITGHRAISEPHVNLNEKTSKWTWPRECGITLSQCPRSI